jgi:hypothetical protein
MGSFALVSMQVDLTRRGAAAKIVQEVVEDFPGTRNVTLDSAAGAVSFEIQFPGNLTALTERLRINLIPVGERASVSLPIRALVPELLDDAEHVRRTLVEGPEIWDVEFLRGHYVYDASMQGDAVVASIVPSSQSMHQLYDALLKLGVVADGEAVPARGR